MPGEALGVGSLEDLREVLIYRPLLHFSVLGFEIFEHFSPDTWLGFRKYFFEHFSLDIRLGFGFEHFSLDTWLGFEIFNTMFLSTSASTLAGIRKIWF